MFRLYVGDKPSRGVSRRGRRTDVMIRVIRAGLIWTAAVHVRQYPMQGMMHRAVNNTPLADACSVEQRHIAWGDGGEGTEYFGSPGAVGMGRLRVAGSSRLQCSSGG